jgi:hypothetical protein
MFVYLVLLLAAVGILGGVVVVAMGRGGQIANFRSDIPIPAMRFSTPDDVALVKLPLAPFGYQVRATEDALVAAAALVDAREAQIAELRRELARLSGDRGEAVGPAAADADAESAAGVETASDPGSGAGFVTGPWWRQ